MAKRGSNTPSPSGSGYQFLNVYLSDEDKERLAALDTETEFPFIWISGLLDEGYKVSFSADSKNHSYICSFTDNRPESAFYRHILTGRGSSALNAWASVCYRHFYLAEQDWTRLPTSKLLESSRFG